MGLISVSLPADGSTADVADYNVPITTITTLVNGQLDNANIVTSAAIDGSKLADASIANTKLASQAWTSWTPTWTNLTVGNGTNSSKYTQVGKTVFFRLMFTFGSTSVLGSGPYFTLPVTAVSYTQVFTVGQTNFYDTSAVSYFYGIGGIRDTTTAFPYAWTVSGANVVITGLGSGTPFTWATGDIVYCQGMYEAA